MPLAPIDFVFGEDQGLILHTAHDFARTELLPLDRACDVDESSVAAILPHQGRINNNFSLTHLTSDSPNSSENSMRMR